MLQRSPRKKRWPVILLAAYTCGLLLGTHLPTEPIPVEFRMPDKLMHLSCYSGLAFLAFLAASARDWFPVGAASSIVRSAFIVILATGTFGAVDELTQYFVPGRIVDVFDLIANLIGCVVGATIFGCLLSSWALVAESPRRSSS